MSSFRLARSMFALVCSALLVIGCSTSDAPQGETGSLSLNLVIGEGVVINEVDWSITGGDMEPMSGTIDTSATGSTASVEVFGLPPTDGEDYTVTLEAVSEDGETTCKGSTDFGVEVGEVTDIMVFLNCKRPQRLGAVRVNGKFNICAEVVKAVVSPLQTSVGNDIDLFAQGEDVEGDPIAYTWSGMGGSFADANAPSTTYTCQQIGDHTITISVTDNDQYCDMATWTVPVTCVDGAGPPMCVQDALMCRNGTIDPIVPCCELPNPPEVANACTGAESLQNPTSCTATGTVITHQLTQLEVFGDCNEGYDLDRCDGVSCNRGGLSPGEGMNGVDNALAGLAPTLAGVGGNLAGLNQAFSDALCGEADVDVNIAGCETAITLLDLQLAVDANLEENCATVGLILDGQQAGTVLLNVSDVTSEGTVCASGALGTIPLVIGGEAGALGNTVVQMTIAPEGFANGKLGATVDSDSAVAVAEALLEGAGAVVAQVLDISEDLKGNVGEACDALSGTYEIGGVVVDMGGGGAGGAGGAGGMGGAGGAPDPCQDVVCEATDCTDSACNSETGLCEDTPTNEAGDCDGGTGTCQSGVCIDNCLGAVCQEIECNVTGCNPLTGQCEAEPVTDGTECDGGNGVCNQGFCEPAITCEYNQDFESLDPGAPNALQNDGWLYFANVYDGTVDPPAFKFDFGGVFPAPTTTGQISGIVTGEGGTDQGAQQLVIFSNYDCCDLGTSAPQGHGNGTDLVETIVFQEINPIPSSFIGQVFTFAFDAKRGNIEGSTTAQAFIKTLDPGAGFATTNNVIFDTTDLPVAWGTYSVSLDLSNPLLEGQILQFGFQTLAKNFEGAGNFYDNADFCSVAADPI